jgi:hypothetical protein
MAIYSHLKLQKEVARALGGGVQSIQAMNGRPLLTQELIAAALSAMATK